MSDSLVVYAIFAAEYGSDGYSLGEETKARCWSAAREMINNPDAIALLAAGLGSKNTNRPSLASLMQEYLVKTSNLSKDRLVIVGSAPNTTSEIASMESWLKEHSNDVQQVIAVSSWYHLPRILGQWFLIGQRLVLARPVWLFTPQIMKRACLEPAKAMLTIIPIPGEYKIKLGQWFRARNLI